MLKIKPLKIFVLLFAIENIMSKTYLIETTAEEQNGKYYTNTRKVFCEAQGKGRAKGPLRKVTQRSFIDYRLSIIDILSLELTLNLVASTHPDV